MYKTIEKVLISNRGEPETFIIKINQPSNQGLDSLAKTIIEISKELAQAGN